MKAILKNGQPSYQSQYKVWIDLDGNQTSTKGATDAQWTAWGFKDVIEVTVTPEQILGDWYETETEITRQVGDKLPEVIAEELQSQRKAERNELLRQGIIVNNIWFNEDKLTQFTVMAQMVSSMGNTTFEWGFEDGFAPITIEDAFNTVMIASTQFQQIYKDSE